MTVTGMWNASLFCSGTGLGFSFFVRWQTVLLLCAVKMYLCKGSFSPAIPSHLLTFVTNEPKLAIDLEWLYQLFFNWLYWSGKKANTTSFYDNIDQRFMTNMLKSWFIIKQRNMERIYLGLKARFTYLNLTPNLLHFYIIEQSSEHQNKPCHEKSIVKSQ